jgi:hypothetical protein
MQNGQMDPDIDLLIDGHAPAQGVALFIAAPDEGWFRVTQLAETAEPPDHSRSCTWRQIKILAAQIKLD